MPADDSIGPADPSFPPSAPDSGPAPGAQDDIIVADFAESGLPKPQKRPHKPPPRRKRRTRLPLILFGLTCISTFWAGAAQWFPQYFVGAMLTGDTMLVRRTIVSHWDDGLIFMVCMLAILLTHEMGHFVATVLHRIPASWPYFIPMPIGPFGTMGAVIGMDGTRANRRELFDIGIAGPIAGLVVAVPIMWIGVQQLDLTGIQAGGYALDMPLVLQLAMVQTGTPGYEPGDPVWLSQLNPYFMAGWVGLLITGLNMLPVSQLDGGHVTYTLFGKRAHWVARGFMVLAIAYVVYAGAVIWALMIVLVLLIGADHPPTRDDSVPLGWIRLTLGFASLSIPFLCMHPHGMTFP